MTLHLSALEAERLLAKQGKPIAKAVRQAAKGSQEAKLKMDTLAQLQGLPAWEAEHRFHPRRRWRLDYAWVEQQIALEVHGGVRSGGRHTRGTGFTNDREKMNEAVALGWTVIEATAEQVRNGQARSWLDTIFNNRGARG